MTERLKLTEFVFPADYSPPGLYLPEGNEGERSDAPDRNHRLRNNRLKRVDCSPTFLDEVAHSPFDAMVLVPGQIPEDVQICGMGFGIRDQCFSILLSSAEFDPVPDGGRIPEIQYLQIKRQTSNDAVVCHFLTKLRAFLHAAEASLGLKDSQDLDGDNATLKNVVIWPSAYHL